MCQFIETIRYQDGKFHNLEYHQRRFQQTIQAHKLDIDKNIRAYLKSDTLEQNKIYKYRIEYSKQNIFTSLEEYHKKSINSLKIIKTDIDYQYKYANRDEIKNAFDKKSGSDDILIVKNNLITDTSYCNVALFNSESWFTPHSPLLQGTMRNKLIDDGIILEKDMIIDDLQDYSKIALFNAMIPWDNKICISVSNIHT